MVTSVLAILMVILSGRMRKIRRFHIFVGLYVIWTIMGLLWTKDTSITMQRSQTIIQMAAMVWLIWELANTKAVQRKILGAYMFGIWITVGATLYPLLFLDIHLRRYTIGTFNPNLIGALAVIGIPIALYLAATQKHRIWRWANLAYVPAGAFTVLLSGSRASLGAMVFSSILILILFMRSGIITKGALLIFGIVASIFIAINIPYATFLRLSSMEAQVLESALPFRIAIWDAGLFVLNSGNALLGIGGGTYENAVDTYLGHSKPPHNVFIGTLVELGPIGLIFFVGILINTLRSVMTIRGVEKWLWLILILMWTIMAVFHNAEIHKHTWFLFALAFSSGSKIGTVDDSQTELLTKHNRGMSLKEHATGTAEKFT